MPRICWRRSRSPRASGFGHVKVPIVAPFNLGLNGNAITVSPALHAAIMAEIDGDRFDPMATALALARVVAARRKSGAEPLTFGMTFPFSTHNYQLRFWMAAGGVDPDEDVRLVVLPPPYMVDSLANGHVDAFCVGAPWNSIAVDLGIGHILHFVSDILVARSRRCWRSGRTGPRKIPMSWCGAGPGAYSRRRIHRAAAEPRRGGAHSGAAGAHRRRCRCDPANARRPPEDFARRHHPREQPLSAGGREGAARPDPAQAAWLYAQMVRWGQAACVRTR
jgi:ABC-type nitrate/sulfonate/bicarbonate transport system substrate-binding protein